jgi:CubicO group peptidase (beta-lactamase class C family)
LLLALRSTGAQEPDLAALSDKAFAKWKTPDGPGCAVAVDRPGKPRFLHAYGLAELENSVPNRPETIFEAGSISKQFTAGDIVLLAIDGKLRLDDDIRKYIPEMPDYGRTITIRHLLNHTSGLRDWSSIVDLEGWPRGKRAFTMDDVLAVIARQSATNYPPGDLYSYTNSGYSLLSIIVSRVSGKTFGEFSTERLFKPLGLTSTQWRDDYTRLVKGRAQAYTPRRSGGWELTMPFENAVGNGGLLTTVTDLLNWTAMLDHPTPAWRALSDSMHVRGILTNGDTITYALGLMVDKYRGLPRVEHSGATAGYRADLERFPGKGVAIAVLCNDASANPGSQVHELEDALLVKELGPAPAAVVRAPRTEPASTWTPTARELAGLTGKYYSSDVRSTLTISVENGALILFRPSATRVTLRPITKDHFAGFLQDVWFSRGPGGQVEALHIKESRAYDVVYTLQH